MLKFVANDKNKNNEIMSISNNNVKIHFKINNKKFITNYIYNEKNNETMWTFNNNFIIDAKTNFATNFSNENKVNIIFIRFFMYRIN